jgi:hypothetical protein
MKDYRFEIFESEFHGGKHLAYSNSIKNAVKIRGCCAGTDCKCGGAYIKFNPTHPANKKYLGADGADKFSEDIYFAQ